LNYDRSPYRWGFEIRDTETKHELFKLGLDPTREREASDLERRYPTPFALPPVRDESCEKLVVDYLTALRKHTDYVLENTLLLGVVRSALKEYIITVPAMWSEKAKAKTLFCAAKAGMGSEDRIHMIAEPEAAALFELNMRANLGLKIGDTFVVCDAGGGYAIALISELVCFTNV
jgi:hypothetical protein